MSRATQYQILATKPDGNVFEVGFSRIKSRDGIVRCIRRRAEHFIAVSGVSRDAVFHYAGSKTLLVEDWTVTYSGRTLRDVEFKAQKEAA